MDGLCSKSTVYGLNGQRAYFVIALSLVIYEHAIWKSRSFAALFSWTPHVPNTKLSLFASISCDDDGPVRQTGSEAALNRRNRRELGDSGSLCHVESMRGSALTTTTYKSNALRVKTVLPLFCRFYGPKTSNSPRSNGFRAVSHCSSNAKPISQELKVEVQPESQQPKPT
jgi:hypothetical protein